MKTNTMVIDPMNETIAITKAFYNKACVFGTNEYSALRAAKMDNPTYSIIFKTVDKKTYNGLKFDRMSDYIKTQPNSEQRLKEFEEVKKIAAAKGGKYPLTKKWFLDTYPEYKESEIKEEAIKNAIANEAKDNSNVVPANVGSQSKKAA